MLIYHFQSDHFGSNIREWTSREQRDGWQEVHIRCSKTTWEMVAVV